MWKNSLPLLSIYVIVMMAMVHISITDGWQLELAYMQLLSMVSANFWTKEKAKTLIIIVKAWT